MDVSLFLMGARDETYEDVLRQADRAEEFGFRRVVLAERHFRHHDLLCPSPLTVAGAIAARTNRIRIGVFGRVLSLDHPIHIAEDAATVDVLSGGRFDFGVARASLDEESHAAFESPMAESEERFDEALDVILRAWTSDELSHDGAHFRFPTLAVFPRPVQRPHPPVFIVAVSEGRLSYAAGRGHSAVIGALAPVANVADARERFESERAATGEQEDGSAGLHVNRFVHVAESDRRAREQLEGPFAAFIEQRAPDLRAVLEARHGGTLPSFDRMTDDFLVVGSPETVAARLLELRAHAGITSLLVTLNFVTLDQAVCNRSLELFGRAVLPELAAAA
jgi:alkanesulfonate monooxygenase SsuD/methylene tetrahydromethanopterin reductase-like flavin-dependent oxidoreductase (luciferase family)